QLATAAGEWLLPEILLLIAAGVHEALELFVGDLVAADAIVAELDWVEVVESGQVDVGLSAEREYHPAVSRDAVQHVAGFGREGRPDHQVERRAPGLLEVKAGEPEGDARSANRRGPQQDAGRGRGCVRFPIDAHSLRLGLDRDGVGEVSPQLCQGRIVREN